MKGYGGHKRGVSHPFEALQKGRHEPTVIRRQPCEAGQ